MGSRAAKVIAGNTRDGRLYSLGINTFEGERRVAGGKFESMRFNGKRQDCISRWKAWREETAGESVIRVERKTGRKAVGTVERKTGRKAVGMVESEEIEMAANEGKVYVLAFKGQRSQRDVAVFESEDEALRMATALSVALEASGTDGEYDVIELPVWG